MNLSTLQIERSDLRYLLNLVKSEVKREINCHAVGTIQTFDPITATATISMNYKKVLKQRNAVSGSPNNYTDVIVDYPFLVRVPVMFLGGGAAVLTFPVQQGDTCLLMFCDRDIDLWLELGGLQSPPNTERLHDLSDAVALIGPRAVTNPIPGFNSSVASLTDQTGERLNCSGDIKPSYQRASHSGWLLMDGSSTVGNTGSGATYEGSQYQSLFNLLGGSGWSGGGKVILPQGQGNTIAGYKAGDPNFGTFGAQIGESAHQLTIPEIPSHAHLYGSADNITAGGGINGTSDNTRQWNTSAVGGDQPHNNIQPTLILNWFIKI